MTETVTVTGELPARSAVHREDTWDLSTIYADTAAWEADFNKVKARQSPGAGGRGPFRCGEGNRGGLGEAILALVEVARRNLKRWLGRPRLPTSLKRCYDKRQTILDSYSLEQLLRLLDDAPTGGS